MEKSQFGFPKIWLVFIINHHLASSNQRPYEKKKLYSNEVWKKMKFPLPPQIPTFSENSPDAKSPVGFVPTLVLTSIWESKRIEKL